MTENKTLCIACKYKFHDRDLQPCADCLRSTQLAQQGIDRYQRAAQPQQASPASETRKVHPAARTLCFACKYMYCDWDAEPCLTCLRHTLGGSGAGRRLRAGAGVGKRQGFMNFAKYID